MATVTHVRSRTRRRSSALAERKTIEAVEQGVLQRLRDACVVADNALDTHLLHREIRKLIHEGIQTGKFRPIYATFVRESTGLLLEAIADGRLLDRTGLSTQGAYSELATLTVRALESDAMDAPQAAAH